MDALIDFIDTGDAMHLVAVMGDLSMGQPLDHSRRVAALAARLVDRLGHSQTAMNHARQIALLRWSGCTANAPEIAATLGDDVAGRAAMLALQYEKIQFLVPPQDLAGQATLISSIHCEVSSLIATMMGLDAEVTDALGCVFEHWDGSGRPRGLAGDAIPALALIVSLCSELEIFARVHGLSPAMTLLSQRANVVYPSALVKELTTVAGQWLDELALQPPSTLPVFERSTPAHQGVDMALIGHVIDLKLPWLTGQSRSVVGVCDVVGLAMGIPPSKRATLRCAGWLHGIGRVTIPNALWNRANTLTAGEQERTRLAPYWTARAGQQVESLAPAAELASHAHEWLDGSGYFRGLSAAALPIESRILAAAVGWVEYRSERPWRPALEPAKALAQLRTPQEALRYDAQVINALASCVLPDSQPRRLRPSATKVAPLLSAREIDVLRRVSLGDSNKLAAQTLGISPSTVRTHMESIFHKLQCSTRAACTLRASVMGLLD